MIIINYDVFTLYIPHHDHHYDDQESKEKKNEMDLDDVETNKRFW